MSEPACTAANERRWQEMKVKPELVAALDHVARRLAAADAKTRYAKVAATTRVPWFIIAVIHEREASQSWAANIAQGDPWNKKSRHVPRGRGPFASWEDAAVDALVHCGPYAARWTDWSAGGALTLLEQYNGLGYARRGLPSPYIWASTDQYVRGKYVADGHFDAHAVDHQLGCAALISRMAAMDQSVVFAESHHC
jgi:lysozyme family protein